KSACRTRRSISGSTPCAMTRNSRANCWPRKTCPCCPAAILRAKRAASTPAPSSCASRWWRLPTNARTPPSASPPFCVNAKPPTPPTENPMNELQTIIDQAWDKRAELNPGSAPAKVGAAVSEAVAALDEGKLRVAEKIDGAWVVHQWLKKAVLLSFRLEDNAALPGAATQY